MINFSNLYRFSFLRYFNFIFYTHLCYIMYDWYSKLYYIIVVDYWFFFVLYLLFGFIDTWVGMKIKRMRLCWTISSLFLKWKCIIVLIFVKFLFHFCFYRKTTYLDSFINYFKYELNKFFIKTKIIIKKTLYYVKKLSILFFLMSKTKIKL